MESLIPFILTGLLLILLVYIFLQIWIRRPHTKTSKDRLKYREGIAMMKSHQYQQAYTYFDQVVKKDPRSALAFAYRGKCRLAMGHFYAAIVDCNQAASLDYRLAEAYLDKGIAMYKLEMYCEALLEFNKSVWYFKKNGLAYRWRGLAGNKLGFREKAWEDFHKAVQLGDEHANYYLLQKGGNLDIVEQVN